MSRSNENHVWFSEFLVYPIEEEFSEFDREFRNFRYSAINCNRSSADEKDSILTGFDTLELMILRLRMELDKEIEENMELQDKITNLQARTIKIEG